MSKKEEIINAIIHGIGAVLAISGLVVLIVLASWYGTAWHIVGYAVFGSMMVMLYLMSTLYHSLTNKKAKRLFRKFDHMSIFLFIAGTYTPFCLAILQTPWKWIMLGVIWSCAILGVVLKAFYTGKKELISTILYITLGWLVIVMIKPLYMVMSVHGFIFLIFGGISYTLGTYFFMKDQRKYHHAIWHLFVLFGSVFHYFSALSLLYQPF